jgi:hypothetical protein
MVVVPARHATQPGGIGTFESILGLLKSLKFGLRLQMLTESIPWNRFLGSLNVKKFGFYVHRNGSGWKWSHSKVRFDKERREDFQRLLPASVPSCESPLQFFNPPSALIDNWECSWDGGHKDLLGLRYNRLFVIVPFPSALSSALLICHLQYNCWNKETSAFSFLLF